MMRPASAEMVRKWLELLLLDESAWDQNVFNNVFRRGLTHIPGNKFLFGVYHGSLTMGILPVSLFCSGHTFFVQRLPQTLGVQPYVVHATFQFSGTPGKRHRFREAMLWNDHSEYYDPPSGVLTFDLDVPKAMLDASVPNAPSTIDISSVQGHFKLVNYQLLQVSCLLLSRIFVHMLIRPSGSTNYHEQDCGP